MIHYYTCENIPPQEIALITQIMTGMTEKEIHNDEELYYQKVRKAYSSAPIAFRPVITGGAQLTMNTVIKNLNDAKVAGEKVIAIFVDHLRFLFPEVSDGDRAPDSDRLIINKALADLNKLMSTEQVAVILAAQLKSDYLQEHKGEYDIVRFVPQTQIKESSVIAEKATNLFYIYPQEGGPANKENLSEQQRAENPIQQYLTIYREKSRSMPAHLNNYKVVPLDPVSGFLSEWEQPGYIPRYLDKVPRKIREGASDFNSF